MGPFEFLPTIHPGPAQSKGVLAKPPSARRGALRAAILAKTFGQLAETTPVFRSGFQQPFAANSKDLREPPLGRAVYLHRS